MGRRDPAAARGGAARPVARRSSSRCRPASPPPPWPGCATTPSVRPRPRPADAAAAVAGGPLRHPLPRLGGGAVRPAAPARPRRAAGPRRLRHRRRRPTCASWSSASRTARSPTGCRTPSSRRSRWCWPGRWSAAASTRSTPSQVDGHDGQYGCLPNLVKLFVDRGSAAALDVRCVRATKPPPFALRYDDEDHGATTVPAAETVLPFFGGAGLSYCSALHNLGASASWELAGRRRGGCRLSATARRVRAQRAGLRCGRSAFGWPPTTTSS